MAGNVNQAIQICLQKRQEEQRVCFKSREISIIKTEYKEKKSD